MWDPGQYLRYADERSRPFFELVGRIDCPDATLVVDLGCGPGQLTASLRARWPQAQVIGVDSSAEMLAQARELADGQLRFEQADLVTWRPPAPLDVVVSNATLQWVDRHEDLLGPLVAALRPGGWLAFQVPGNFDAPTHRCIAEQVRAPAWRDRIDPAVLDRPASREPEVYLDRLVRLGCAVDAWTTTYFHQLSGPSPVLQWIKGTALRPVLAALAPADARAFEDELAERLDRAYPPHPAAGTTTLPFRRIFVVARRPS